MAGLDAILSRFRMYNRFRQRSRVEEVHEVHQTKCLMGKANVSLEGGFVFVHVPKNGGTTVYEALGFHDTCHLTTEQYLTFLPDWFVRKAHFFAIYRDPFSRFVSLYNFARQEESYYHSVNDPEGKPYGVHDDYATLKDCSLREAIDLLEAGKLRNDRFCNIWRPQMTWFRGYEKVRRYSIVPLREIDTFLQEHFAGSRPARGSGRLNASRGCTVDDLTAEDRERLRRYYAEDFALAKALRLDSLPPNVTAGKPSPQ